jgi:hypothetical protein
MFVWVGGLLEPLFFAVVYRIFTTEAQRRREEWVVCWAGGFRF